MIILDSQWNMVGNVSSFAGQGGALEGILGCVLVYLLLSHSSAKSDIGMLMDWFTRRQSGVRRGNQTWPREQSAG